MEYVNGRYQRRDIKHRCIPTIINGYAESLQWEDRKALNRDGVSNAQKIPGISDKMKSDGKVIIYGDSHSRGLPAKLKNKLPDSFEVIGYTKPNCDIQTSLSIRNQDITKLSNKDVLVFIGGANDLTRENSSKGLWYISQFVRQNTQTNIILLTIPQWYDQAANAYINDGTKKFNRSYGNI
jgi:hypothetical protein